MTANQLTIVATASHSQQLCFPSFLLIVVVHSLPTWRKTNTKIAAVPSWPTLLSLRQSEQSHSTFLINRPTCCRWLKKIAGGAHEWPLLTQKNFSKVNQQVCTMGSNRLNKAGENAVRKSEGNVLNPLKSYKRIWKTLWFSHSGITFHLSTEVVCYAKIGNDTKWCLEEESLRLQW